MKKTCILFILAILSGCLLYPFLAHGQTIGKNGTVQIPNPGFEEWDNPGNDNIEPVGWNSFQTADCSGLTCAGKAKRLDRVSDKRPSGSGNYCLKIYSTSTLGIIANGNTTTGKVNMGSTSPTNSANYNSTKRGQGGFRLAFTAIPDSLVVWVKFIPKNGSDQARISAILHNDNDTRDPGYNNAEVVAAAQLNFAATGGNWKRISIPFVKTGSTMDARYMLITFTTNKTPGGGNDGDQVFFDDLLFVYNPTISIRDIPALSYGVSSVESTPISIPFRITGTMSPNNTSANNEIRMELSDANGSFDHPVVLGKTVSDESGTLQGNIPAGTPAGTRYKIRMVSTNYPMTTVYDKDIEIYEVFKVIAESVNHRGSISGNIGSYKAGTNIALTAYPNSGNRFMHWSEKGLPISGVGTNYSFVLSENRNLLAHFDTNRYQVNVLAENGVIEGSGEYVHNSNVILTAKANPGYRFVKYSEGNTQLSSSLNYQFLARKDITITAHFEAQTYPITVKSNQISWGSVNGGGTFYHYDSCTVTAIPKAYYEFVAWLRGKDTLSTQAVCTFEVTQAESLEAIFREISYRIDVDIEPLIAGGVSGQGVYKASQQQTIALEAKPEASWQFVKWVETNSDPELSSTQNPYIIVNNGRIQRDMSFRALFKKIGYDVSVQVSPKEGGNYQGDESYPHGETVALKAIPNTAYEFIAWVDAETGDTVCKTPEYNYISLRKKEWLLVFQLKTYPIKLSAIPEEMGSIQGSGEYNHFDTVHAKAIANKGFELRYWIEKKDTLSLLPNYSFSVDKARNITAHFSYKRKHLNLTTQPAHIGSVNGGGVYEHNTEVRLSAVASKGYNFSHWESNGKKISDFSSFTLRANNDSLLVAVFAPIKYTLTLQTADMNGQISFADSIFSHKQTAVFDYGTPISILAKPLTQGFRFTHWSVQESSFSTSDSVSFLVSEDKIFIANFSDQTKEVSAHIHPVEGGRVLNLGNHNTSNWVELEAVPNYGYVFEKWADKDGLTLNEKDPFLYFKVMTDTLYQAYFLKKDFQLSFHCQPQGAGQIGEDGTYPYLSNVLLSAKAKYGYVFNAWFVNDRLFSIKADTSLPLTEDLRVKAVFDSVEYDLSLVCRPEGTGSSQGNGKYKYLSTQKLSASPSVGFYFVGWIDEQGDTLSVNDSLSIQILGSKTIYALFDTCVYHIDPISSDTNRGIVFGKTYILYDSLAHIRAEAKKGYYFKDWTDENGSVFSTQDSLSFPARKNLQLTANFQAFTYQIRTESLQENAGQTIGDGAYQYGKTVKIEAVPAYGYRFKHWTNNDTNLVVSTYPIFEFKIGQDSNWRAAFEKKSFKINVLSNSIEGGIVEGGNSFYLYEDTLSIKAHPKSCCYKFNYWEADGVRISDDSIFHITVDKDCQFKAIFETLPFKVKVDILPDVYGEIEGQGEYAYGSTVELIAKPFPNYFIDGWKTGHFWITEQDTLRFTLTQDTSFFAVFRTDTFLIRTNTYPIGAGEVDSVGHVLSGQTCLLNAKATYGYKFSAWKSGDSLISEFEESNISPKSSALYTAYFEPNIYSLSLSTTPYAIDHTISGSGRYAYGEEVEIKAVSDSVYQFSHWIFSGETALDSLSLTKAQLDSTALQENILRFILKENAEMQAVFTKARFMVEAEVFPIQTGQVSNTGYYDHGAKAELSAQADNGYTFKHWTYEGSVVGDSVFISFDVSKALLFIAHFDPAIYQIKLNAYPASGGIVNGAGSYRYLDTVKLSCIPLPGYQFVEWKNEKGKTESKDSLLKVLVSKNSFYTAVLQKKTGLDEAKPENLPWHIYPNPVKNTLYIKGLDMDKIEFFNLTGTLVYQKNIAGKELEISMEKFVKGVYLFRISKEGLVIQRGKVLKQ